MKRFIDTCVLTELDKAEPDAQVLRWFGASKTYQLWVSAMTLAELHRSVNRMPAFESIIAATGRANGCKLATRNVKDFNHGGIEVLNPWFKK